MKSPQTKKTLPLSTAVLIAAPVVLMLSMAAMNGGTSLTASAFDSVVTTLKGILTSSWTLMLVIIALIAVVWSLAHGGGYGRVSLIIGILALALIGPDMATSMATAMPTAQQLKLITAGPAVTADVLPVERN